MPTEESSGIFSLEVPDVDRGQTVQFNGRLTGERMHDGKPQSLETDITGVVVPKPDFDPNSAHTAGQPSWRPNKTPEPKDSADVFENVIFGGNGNWYGVGGDGTIYRYGQDNVGGAHFNGKTGPDKNDIPMQDIPNNIRKELGFGGKPK